MDGDRAPSVFGVSAKRLSSDLAPRTDSPFQAIGSYQKPHCDLPIATLQDGHLAVLIRPFQIRPLLVRFYLTAYTSIRINVFEVIVMPTRVAIYSRISTKDKGQDCENQLRQLRAFAETQGYTVVSEFVDHASGKTSEREAFAEMFAAASRRGFDVLLFWSLDRLSREGVLETLQHLQRLTGYGVGYRSYTEQFLDSCGPFKDAVISILATIGKQERIRLSERTVAGLERARAAGRIGGRPRVICDRPKVLALRNAGRSLGKIAVELRLNKSTVARIIRDAASAAEVAA
jgi:DNA invertase Pin-like site-specific DNA recombinase